MLQAHVYISGFVQGVGFRQFIKINADKLNLDGFVRNLRDTRVEAVFQGSKDKIEEIISLCKKGTFLAEVENVEVVWEEGKAKSDLAKEKLERFEISV